VADRALTVTELLAPAGNLAKLKTALRYGADAVYLGGPRFGLRYASDNFSQRELELACGFAHARDRKVFLVLNAFLFGEEVAALRDYLPRVEATGVDAVIVSDLGVMETVVAHSRLRVHVSTQASVLNSDAASFWKATGARRIVLGREVSIREACAIRSRAGLEVEMFVHGAMCMSYSGHCTISNYTAGRDSNRGGCAQSCRFAYSLNETDLVGSFMSSKDLLGIRHLPAMVQAGVDSLKIEGRMKSLLYVASTARAYRRTLDAALGGEPLPETAVEDLLAVSQRSQTSGNLIQSAGSDSVLFHESSQPRHLQPMVGSVLQNDPDGYLVLQLNNRLEAGSPCEIMTFDGQNLALDTGAMMDVRKSYLACGRPNSIALFPGLPGAREGMLVRTPVTSRVAV